MNSPAPPGVIPRRRAAHSEYARACGARVNHRSAVHRGNDSFTAPELTATRSRRTMTAAHAASLILNKCFKVRQPAARDAESRTRWRGASVPGQAGARRAGLAPTRPPRRAVAHRWVPAALAAALPIAPLLSVASYIIAPADPNGSGARAAGAARQRCSLPEPEGLPTQLPGEGRKAPSARPARPLAKALDRGRSPSGSRERHQLRQLLQTPCPALSSPGAAAVGPGPRAALASAPRGRRKFPGTLPSPARPSRAASTGSLAWATWDPRLRATPAVGRASTAASAGISPRAQRKIGSTIKTSPNREASRVPEHRSYLALGRPRSGRAARGAWCTSARAWGGR